jgi:diadenosine tetraphosphate (Ap4A) HIT family hydrolase
MKRKGSKKKAELTIKFDVEHFVLEDHPWRDPIKENDRMLVFRDGFPVTETGHFLFVPKTNDMDDIAACLDAAVKQGAIFVDQEICDGFNVGMNYGEAAGQTVMWPHIHLILRKDGDCENPRGGVRHVIPGKGDYTKNVSTDTSA